MAVIACVAIVMMLVPAVMASLIALTFREAGLPRSRIEWRKGERPECRDLQRGGIRDGRVVVDH
jgi:hypothetical protein